MKGSALGFSFISLISALFLGLVLFGGSVGVIIDLVSEVSVITWTLPLLFILCLNIAITIGLKNRKVWAIFAGSAEVSALMILILFNLWQQGISALIWSVFSLPILASLLALIYKDYLSFKNPAVSRA